MSLLFAAVDVTALLNFLNSILPTLAGIDPAVAGLGALILFIVQKIGGKSKFDLWGTVKAVLRRFAPVKADGTPVEPKPLLDVVEDGVEVAAPVLFPNLNKELLAHEIEVVRRLVEKLKALREPEVPVEAKADELFGKLLK